MNIEQAMINGNERALISEMTVAQYSLEEIHEVLRLLHELTKKEPAKQDLDHICC
ncbi:hypothetical protein [Limosilactobacillus coleohominis]|uniref:hypothetical protein n=1 Tax=Limosilactobacillus coleohominis TaxID=181675 RepID=UPI0019598048|nr:hypothetical protein [Limosilactobacillus coleohominis]MBM6954715.1 hypothetical protein [Limosilactobacillus coleohominis]